MISIKQAYLIWSVSSEQVYSAWSLKLLENTCVDFDEWWGIYYWRVHTQTEEQLWDSLSGETGFQDRMLWFY